MSQQIQLLLNRSPVRVRLVSCDAASAVSAQESHSPSDSEKISEQLIYLEQLLNEVGLAIEDLQKQHRDSLTEMQQATVELSIAAASWIVGAAIEAELFAVDDLVKSLIDRLHKERPIRIYLNPKDAQLLDLLRGSADAEKFAAADIEYLPDSELKRGTVRADSARSTLVTDMDEQLADIRQIWMENLNDTQTERRGDDPAGRGFKRFPERRHTA